MFEGVGVPAHLPLDFFRESLASWGLAQGGKALHLLVSLLLQKGANSLFSLRSSSRWVLLTRILFLTRRGLGQQTQEHIPSAGGVLIIREAVDLIGLQGSLLPRLQNLPKEDKL